MAAAMTRRGRSLERVAARLEALSPVAVLARGYALIYRVGDTSDRARRADNLIGGDLGRRKNSRAAGAGLVLKAEVTETGPE